MTVAFSLINRLKAGLKGRFSVLVCLLLFISNAQAEVQKVPVWTYYLSPPFITGEKAGLSFELIELLNNYSKGVYHFELTPLPRTRINRNLEEGLPGMVLFVNWAWMGDRDKTKYFWSSVILSDRNEIISRVSGKAPVQIEFTGPLSLAGYVFGGELGRYYKGLEAAFADGVIERRDSRREQFNLDMLVHGRIDVTSASASTVRYQINKKGLTDQVYFSHQPLFSYTRHFLLTRPLGSILPHLNHFIEQLKNDQKWLDIKQTYFVE